MVTTPEAPAPAVSTSSTPPSGNEALSNKLYMGGNTALGETIRWTCLPCACLPCGGSVMVQIDVGNVGLLLQFGVMHRVLQPGLHTINPLTQRVVRMSTMVSTHRIEAQQAMTSDNLSVQVDAVTFFFVSEPVKAKFAVEDYKLAVTTLAATTVRVLIGEHTLQKLFSERAAINKRLAQIMQEKTLQWGITIQGVEIRDIKIPDNMKRAMAQVAEAGREAEAKVIVAEGQKRASKLFAEAAETMAKEPISVQLQWFETLRAISQDKSSTVIVPDSILSLVQRAQGASSSQ